jgi:spermidine synthase
MERAEAAIPPVACLFGLDYMRSLPSRGIDGGETVSRSIDAASPRSATPAVWLLVSGLFFLSGSAGLVYQVLWMRSLGLFFGSDMYGVSIILGTFMGGLALGSLLGGRLAERTTRPLLWYGLAELGIGFVGLRFSAILASFDPLLHAAYGGAGGGAGPGYQALRIGLAGGALLLPTSLMGATLPLILKHFVRSRSVLGAAGAYFYAVNTLGALVGTLAAGFVLLPYLGMARATACAAAVNGGIGVVCGALGWWAKVPGDARDAAQPDLDPLPGLAPGLRQQLATAALIAFGVSGFGSFALEVAWTRILLISFSATVYSFAATLACFLFGIFLGSRLVSGLVDRHPNPLALFARLELGIAASVAVLGLLLHVTPAGFGRLLAALGPRLGEHALVAATLLVSFPLLVVPASLLGATFPVALRVYTTSVARVGSRSGDLYASNTLGAVLGSGVAGFVLIPRLGASVTLALLALLFLAVGAALTRVSRPAGPAGKARGALGLAAALALLCGAGALLLPYRPALNFDQASLADAKLLYHAEGVQNTIDVVRGASGATSLIIGGNVEADDGERQRRHFVLKGHLPLLLMREPASVLIVGLGMGITLQATARHPGLERIDVVELSPDILAAQAQLADVNGNVLANPLVHVRIDDGRLFMKLTSERFDMITADPIHPKVSRVGYLYTREYYEAIRAHLNPGGVVCQWMPVYQIAPRRLRSAIKTFLEVFPFATLWYVEGHALLVAKQDSPLIDYALLQQKFDDPKVREDLASIDIASPAQLLAHLRMGPAEIRAYVDAEPDVPLNTDDSPYLEYFVPRDLFYTTADNVRELSRHVVDPAQLLVNVPTDGSVLR